MSAENQNHPADLAEIESLHTRYVDIIFGASNDRLMEFQDKAYAMGRARGKLEAAPQWVPVSERLPENKAQVLCWFGNKQRVALYVEAKSINTEDRHFDGDGEYDEATDQNFWPAGWYCYEDGMEMWIEACSSPSHWMPLPAAPEVQA